MSLQAASLFRVDGIVAVITGGGTGIGLVMARALALNGAKRVFIMGRRWQVLQESAAEVNAEVAVMTGASVKASPASPVSTGPVVPITCDISSRESLQAAVDAVTADPVAQGCVNLLIANAATYGNMGHSYVDTGESVAELRRRLFTEANMTDFNNVLRVNVTGTMLTIYAFLELLDNGNKRAIREPGAFGAPAGTPSPINPGCHPRIQSQIVITVSVGAFMRTGRLSSAYLAAKAAVHQLTKQLSTWLAPHSIRTNGLAPGLFPTEMAAMLMGSRQPEYETANDIRFIPALKFGDEGNMAGSILYLASAAGSFCNGLVLLVDGGRLSVVQSSY